MKLARIVFVETKKNNNNQFLKSVFENLSPQKKTMRKLSAVLSRLQSSQPESSLLPIQ